jgi:hypothetical protein
MLALGSIIIATAFAASIDSAYAHGCPAQGGCCTVGNACVDISPISPMYMMFAVVGVSAVTILTFYSRQEQGDRLGAIFNMFRDHSCR